MKYVLSLIVGVMLGLLIEAGGIVIVPLLLVITIYVIEIVSKGFDWLCVSIVVSAFLVVTGFVHPLIGIGIIGLSVIAFIHSVEGS